MATRTVDLPEGFILESPAPTTELPEGFVLESQVADLTQLVAGIPQQFSIADIARAASPTLTAPIDVARALQQRRPWAEAASQALFAPIPQALRPPASDVPAIAAQGLNAAAGQIPAFIAQRFNQPLPTAQSPLGRAYETGAKLAGTGLAAYGGGMAAGRALPSTLSRFIRWPSESAAATVATNLPEVITKPQTAAGKAAVAAAVGTAAGTIPPAFQFLRGNPAKIKAAASALNKAAHKVVQSLRPKGALHGKVFEVLKRESERAWAPMQSVANSIEGQISLNEVKQVLASNVVDPNRLQAANLVLDDILKANQESFTAPDLVAISSDLGRAMTRASIRGTAARTFDDVVSADVRSAIGEVLEQRAPLELKGAVQQAKQQWSDYAADRDLLFKYFSPAGSSNLPTDRGVRFLKRAAQGNLTPSEAEFLGRVQQTSGVDLPVSIRPFVEKLARAQTVGKMGKIVTSAGSGALGLYGLGRLLGVNFGIGKD